MPNSSNPALEKYKKSSVNLDYLILLGLSLGKNYKITSYNHITYTKKEALSQALSILYKTNVSTKLRAKVSVLLADALRFNTSLVEFNQQLYGSLYFAKLALETNPNDIISIAYYAIIRNACSGNISTTSLRLLNKAIQKSQDNKDNSELTQTLQQILERIENKEDLRDIKVINENELPNQYNSSLVKKLISGIEKSIIVDCEQRIIKNEIAISTANNASYTEPSNQEDLNAYHFLSKLDEIHEPSFLLKLKTSLHNKLQQSPNHIPAMLALAYLMDDNENFLDEQNSRQIYAQLLQKQKIPLAYNLLALSFLIEKSKHITHNPYVRLENNQKYHTQDLLKKAIELNTSNLAISNLLLALNETNEDEQDKYFEQVKKHVPNDLWLCNILKNNKFKNVNDFIQYSKSYIKENPNKILKKILKNVFKKGAYKTIDPSNSPYSLARFQGINSTDAKKSILACAIYQNAKPNNENYKLLDFSNKNLKELPVDLSKLTIRDGTIIDLSDNKFTHIPLELNLLQKPELKNTFITIKLTGNPLDARAMLVANLFCNDEYFQDKEMYHQIILPHINEESTSAHTKDRENEDILDSMAELYSDAKNYKNEKASNKLIKDNRDRFANRLNDYHEAEENIKQNNPDAGTLDINLTKRKLLATNSDDLIDMMDRVIESFPELNAFRSDFKDYLTSLFKQSRMLIENYNSLPSVQRAPSKEQQAILAAISIIGEVIKGGANIASLASAGAGAGVSAGVGGVLATNQEYWKWKFDKKQNDKFNELSRGIRKFISSDDAKYFVESIARFATLSLAPTILCIQEDIKSSTKYSDEDREQKQLNFNTAYVQNLTEKFLLQISKDALKREPELENLDKDLPHKNDLEKFIHYYTKQSFFKAEKDVRQEFIKNAYAKNKHECPIDLFKHRYEFKPYFIASLPNHSERRALR